MFFAEIVDIGSAGFEDPQSQQPEHRHQREIAGVCRISRRCEQRL
ncbi:hypothetical protein [Nocardia albiluteola]|nr:hypothetical protein [Nocardia albiluteola]